jgi:hypothetical protein
MQDYMKWHSHIYGTTLSSLLRFRNRWFRACILPLVWIRAQSIVCWLFAAVLWPHSVLVM